MKPIDLPLKEFYTYLAGYRAGTRDANMHNARLASGAIVKKLYVGWARDNHRAYRDYLKRALEC